MDRLFKKAMLCSRSPEFSLDDGELLPRLDVSFPGHCVTVYITGLRKTGSPGLAAKRSVPLILEWPI
jgi:hypothetical protein